MMSSLLKTQRQTTEVFTVVTGHSNTLAWVLGVVFGALGGLIFAALLAWAIVACMRRKRQREESDGQDPPSNKKSFIPGPLLLPGSV